MTQVWVVAYAERDTYNIENVSSVTFSEEKAQELADGISDVWGGSGLIGVVLGPATLVDHA